VLIGNTIPFTMVTWICGNLMRQHRAKQTSAIINMTSIWGDTPMPSNALYSSSKTYQRVISDVIALEIEKEKAPVDLLTVKHLPIKSKKQNNGVEASDVLEGVLNDLGHETISYGHWKHSLFW